MAEAKPIILSIEGNIGAGKTTFLKIIRESFELSFEIIEEPVAEWKKLTGGTNDQAENLLQLFYEDPNRWGYAFQSYCYFTRMREWTKMKQNLKPNVYLFERSIHSDKFFFFIYKGKSQFFN